MWATFWYVGYGCSEQYPIVTAVPGGWYCDIYVGCQWVPKITDKYNLFKLSESSSGVITMVWDFTQSRIPILRPSRTVNGGMVITPSRCCVWAATVKYTRDGFPSDEMYMYVHSRKYKILNRSEGPYWWMDPGTGDSTTTYRLPQ
jgi:hypothetical protein